MLRSIRPEIRLVLVGDHLLLQQRQPLRRTLTSLHALSGSAKSDDWGQTLTVLPRHARGSLSLYLPSSAFLFWRVPWIDAALNEADTYQLAASLLKQDYGRAPDEMAFSLTPPRFGQARLACGLPHAIVTALRAQLPAGVTLAGVYPLLSLAWPTLTGTSQPLLCSEPGLAALYLPDASGPQLHTRRLPAGHAAGTDTAESMAALFGIDTPRQVRLQLDGATLALTEPQTSLSLARGMEAV